MRPGFSSSPRLQPVLHFLIARHSPRAKGLYDSEGSPSIGVVCIAFAAMYAWMAARSFQAARLASSLDVPSLQRAIALAPGDAVHQDLLCRYLLFDKQAAAAALPYCQRATELSAETPPTGSISPWPTTTPAPSASSNRQFSKPSPSIP